MQKLQDPVLSVFTASAGTAKKGASMTLTIWWPGGITATNWVMATVYAVEENGNIKTKFQRRVTDYNGSPAIKVGIDNDSGSSVTLKTVVMVDVGDTDLAAKGEAPGEPQIVVKEE